MLVHPWDAALDDAEWQKWLRANEFGHLIAPGRDRDLPVVVPTQFVVADDATVLLHLARPNPVWAALAEKPRALLAVSGDWAYVPSSWGAAPGTPPELGVPTTHYAAVQLACDAEVCDDDETKRDVLRATLARVQPEGGYPPVEPGVEHYDRLLSGIRALRLRVTGVQAKFKYAGNKDHEHRLAIADRYAERRGPGDAAAARHLLRRDAASTTQD